jgi:hypothetical protein
MNDRERIKRPEPERAGPMRRWSLFGTGDASAGRTSDGTSDPPLSDVISRSVDIGYRVVDDYIRQGQRAAERMSRRAYGPETFTSDAQELSARMMKYTSDLFATWFEFMEVMIAGGAARAVTTAGAVPPPPSRAAPVGPAAPSAVAADHARVKVEIASPWPTEVSLDLRPATAGGSLVVHALRAVDPEKPRIDDVVLTPASADEPATLRIRIPVIQPAGVYNGLILDERTSRPAGTLSVRVIRD